MNVGQATLASVSNTGYAPFSSGGFTTSTTNLNDGAAGLSSTGFPNALATIAFDLDGVWVTTFTLDTTVNTNGYSIRQVQTIGGWLAARADQKYRLEYAPVNSPQAFLPLGVFSLDASALNGSSRITLVDSSGRLAENVKSLRFSFQSLGGGAETVYREVDVFGDPTTNGPAPPPPLPPLAPGSTNVAYSDCASVAISDTEARFDRLISADSGMGYDNPAARVRFRTDATNLAANLYYTAQHTHGAQNAIGIVLVDGVHQITFTPSTRPGVCTVPIFSGTNAQFRTVELLMPYGDSVVFQGGTLNTSAQFQVPPPRPATRYVAYGDSITQGYWASDVTNNYPSRVGVIRNWEIVNMGFGGRQAVPADGSVVGALGAGVITIMMGVNDALAGKTAVQFRSDYASWIANVRALDARVPIYAIAPLWCNAAVSLLDQYRAAISNIVATAGDPRLHLIDGLGLIPAGTAYFPDGIHPNDAGFAIMATNLASLLQLEEPGGVLLRFK